MAKARLIGRGAIFLWALLLLWVSGVRAAPTTAEEARTVVANWRVLVPKPMDASLGQQVRDVQTFADASGPLYFVVHLEPAGLVIVPADDLVEPILGFMPEATTYDPSPANPLGALVSGDVPGRVNWVRQSQAAARARGLEFAPTGAMQQARQKWDLLSQPPPPPGTGLGAIYLSDVRVAPLVQSTWAQDYVGSNYGYNYYTPKHYPCGCTATAMAQVMRYHQHPTLGVGTPSFTIKVDGVDQPASLQGGDGSGGPYNWALMPLAPVASTPLSELQQIGALVYDAGVAVKMKYTASGSGALINNEHAFTNVFKYGNAINGYGSGTDAPIPWDNFYDMVLPNLYAGLPVLLGILKPNPAPPNDAHAILTDGYGWDLNAEYFHLNMGWSGLADAWYNPAFIDSNTYGINNFYNVIYLCTYNIYPSGTGEIIGGRVLDYSDQPISGAAVVIDGVGTKTTNAKGIFSFTHLASGTDYTIRVTAPGYTFEPQKKVSTGTSTDGPTVGNRRVFFRPKSGFVKWGYYTGGSAYSPPALSPDGATAYMGSTDENLYAINTADGTLKWTYNTRLFAESPAVAPDGTIYVGGDGGLYALTPTGAQIWKCPIGGAGSPVIGPNGTIYVESGQGFHAVSPGGEVIWEWNPEKSGVYGDYGKATCAPAVAKDGTVYVGLCSANWVSEEKKYFIRAFNPSGGKKWDSFQATEIYSTPALGWDGTIYVGLGNNLAALNPGNGAVQWQYPTGDKVNSPAVGPDGTVYVGSLDHYLYALDPVTHALKWKYDAGAPVGSNSGLGYGYHTPAIGVDGVIYLSAWNGIHAVKPDGTEKWKDLSCWSDSSPAIGPDGTVYVGVGNSLVAFQSTSKGLANAAWPMFHHDLRHTGLLSGTSPPPPTPPVANFSASPGSGFAPLTVLFQDTSTGLVTTRSWNFGDGGGVFPPDSPSPSHTYKSPGSYTVTMSVSGPGGSSNKTGTIAVTAPSLPVADFTATPTSGVPPLTVQFTDASSGYITGRKWDFGDGSSMPVPSPSHTYTAPGEYRVMLTVSNYAGSNSKTADIAVGAPIVAGFTATPTKGPAPLTVQFTDTSTGDILAWLWDFGDGGSSFDRNPNYTYNKPGIYPAKLHASGPRGWDEKTATITATQTILTDKTTVSVPKGGVARFGVKLGSEPTANTVVSATKVSGIPEITLVNESNLTFTPANWATYQWVQLAATKDNNNLNGQAIIQLSAAGAPAVAIIAVKTGAVDLTNILGLLLSD